MTETLPNRLPVMISARPSALTSAIEADTGFEPIGMTVFSMSSRASLCSRTTSRSVPATTRSGSPSPSRSPAARSTGLTLVSCRTGPPKILPPPWYIVWTEKSLATARSRRPSPSRSDTRSFRGSSLIRIDFSRPSAPCPSFQRRRTRRPKGSRKTKSAAPSPSRSVAWISVVPDTCGTGSSTRPKLTGRMSHSSGIPLRLQSSRALLRISW